MNTFEIKLGVDIFSGDFRVDYSSTTKRILRVIPKTLPDKCEYIFVNILKKEKDKENVISQRIELAREEFDVLVILFSKETGKCLCCDDRLTKKDILGFKTQTRLDTFKIDTGDFYYDIISRTTERILRVTLETLPDKCEYISIKIFKKGKDKENFKSQRIVLTRDEFEAMVKLFSKETKKCLGCGDCRTVKDIMELYLTNYNKIMADIENFFASPADETTTAGEM